MAKETAHKAVYAAAITGVVTLVTSLVAQQTGAVDAPGAQEVEQAFSAIEAAVLAIIASGAAGVTAYLKKNFPK